jgi:hypothetical protein
MKTALFAASLRRQGVYYFALLSVFLASPARALYSETDHYEYEHLLTIRPTNLQAWSDHRLGWLATLYYYPMNVIRFGLLEQMGLQPHHFFSIGEHSEGTKLSQKLRDEAMDIANKTIIDDVSAHIRLLEELPPDERPAAVDSLHKKMTEFGLLIPSGERQSASEAVFKYSSRNGSDREKSDHVTLGPGVDRLIERARIQAEELLRQ